MKIIEIISEGGKVDQPVYVIGDSIGVGIQNAGGVDGDTKGGINTRQVLDKVQKFVDSGKAKGTLVILSSGASNSTYERKNGSKQELDIAPVVQQLRLLKQAGAIPVLVGSASGASAWITNKYGEYRVNFSSEQVNEKLSAAAKEANVKFLGPLEDYDPKIGVEKGGDGIHPFNGYAKLFKAATSGGSGAMVSPLGDKEDNKNSGSSSFELDVPDSRTGPAVADIQKALEALAVTEPVMKDDVNGQTKQDEQEGIGSLSFWNGSFGPVFGNDKVQPAWMSTYNSPPQNDGKPSVGYGNRSDSKGRSNQ